MQPPDSRGSRLNLPPLGGAADLMCYIYRRHKYVTIAFEHRDGGGEVKAFTLHQVEARKLAKLFQAAADQAEVSADTCLFGGVEGVYPGGPPEVSQIIEPKAKG